VSLDEVPHSRTVLGEEDIEAAVEVLRSGQVNESEVTRELERVASAMLGRTHAWAAAGGTAALYSALLTMGIGEGDEVLIPTYVCDDVLSAVLQAGATPVPVDLDPEDLNPDPADAAERIGERTRAVVAAHVLGMPARVEDFEGAAVIEDCAHGLGAEIGGRPAGSLGECTVISFHGLKMVHAGEGGMVLTDSESIWESYQARRFPDFAAGQYRLHSRMSNVLAAVAISQLGRLAKTVAHRRALARTYLDAVGELPRARAVAIEGSGGRRSSCYRFGIVAAEGMAYEEIEGEFAQRGVIVRRPVKQLCHRTLGIDAGGYPNAEAVFDRVVSLPLYPSLAEDEQQRVIAAAREIFA